MDNHVFSDTNPQPRACGWGKLAKGAGVDGSEPHWGESTREQISNNLCELEVYRASGVTPDHVQRWAEAERDGRLVVLPCRVGDEIYQLRGKRHARREGVSTRYVSAITFLGDGSYRIHHQGMTDCTSRDFNRTWFLAREEAEAALERMEMKNGLS